MVSRLQRRHMSIMAITVTSHGRQGVWNYRILDCLYSNMFRPTIKETAKPTLPTLIDGIPPVTGGFPPQRSVMQKAFPCHDLADFWKLVVWYISCFVYKLTPDATASDEWCWISHSSTQGVAIKLYQHRCNVVVILIIIVAGCSTATYNLPFRCIYNDGLMQDCSNSIANAMELLQPCTKSSIYTFDLMQF